MIESQNIFVRKVEELLNDDTILERENLGRIEKVLPLQIFLNNQFIPPKKKRKLSR